MDYEEIWIELKEKQEKRKQYLLNLYNKYIQNEDKDRVRHMMNGISMVLDDMEELEKLLEKNK